MLTPEQMDEAGETVAEVYRQIEAELIDYLTHKMCEGDLSGQRVRTAIGLLSQKDIAEITRIINSHADEVDAAVLEEVKSLLEASDAFDLAAIAKGIGTTVASDALTLQTLLVVASVREAMARDNLEMAAAARTKFLQWTTWASAEVATGNMTADKALRKAVRELARGGLSIKSVTYRDELTGKVTVTNKADVAISRHIRSLIGQGAAQLTFERMRENDMEFVEVSSHAGARPSHAEWQGRCYHIGGDMTVDDVFYPDFYEGTGYRGERGPYTALGDQLLGVNCRHSFAPWVPGSPRAYEPEPKSPTGLSNDEIYKLTQGQRARERKIREAKRELSAAQIAYDTNPSPENAAEVTRAKLKLQKRQEGMREYIREANAKCKPGTEVLKRLPNREWAGDMPKVATKRAIMTAMKHEEPLVKISKTNTNSLSVSPIVNTQAFHDAFIKMPVPKAVCESAYRQAGRILSKTNGTQNEHLVAISARTGAVIADNLDVPAAERRTGFRKSDIDKIKANPDKILFIHNHPMSINPSYRDIITASDTSLVAGSIVVGHDGSVWYFSVKDPLVAEQLEKAYNLLKDLLGDRAEYTAVKRFLEKENGKTIDWRRLR